MDLKAKIASWFLNRAQKATSENHRIRVILSDNSAYLDVVDMEKSAEDGYVIEDNYSNIALFFSGVANEVDISPILEEKDLEGDGHGKLAGLDIQTSGYINKFMKQTVFEDIMFTRARRSIADSATLQYIMMGMIGIIGVLMLTQVM